MRCLLNGKLVLEIFILLRHDFYEDWIGWAAEFTLKARLGGGGGCYFLLLPTAARLVTSKVSDRLEI